MNSLYDYALQNLSLRIERNYGLPLRFKSGTNNDGSGWCESFFRGISIDKAIAASGADEAKKMIIEQPLSRLVYDQLRIAPIKH